MDHRISDQELIARLRRCVEQSLQHSQQARMLMGETPRLLQRIALIASALISKPT